MKLLLIFLSFILGPAFVYGQGCVVGVMANGVTLGLNQSKAVQTANTLALNQIFSAIGNGSLPCHNVEFPEGVVEVDSPINVNLGSITIGGVNREQSIVLQTTAGAPVFVWNSNSTYMTGISMHDLGLDNSNNSGSYQSGQWGLQFQCSGNGQGGNGWGYANNQFSRLSIKHMNVGIGEWTSGGGVCPMWSTHFEDIKFDNIQQHAIFLVSSGNNIGQPANQLDRIDILQENSPPTNTGDAIYIVGGTGLVMNSIDIEGWENEEVQIYGGDGTVINNLRIEHAKFSGCNPAIAFFDGDVTLNGTAISWDQINHGCVANVFSVSGSTSILNVNGMTLSSTSGIPSKPITVWRVDQTNSPAKLFASGLTLNGIASEYMPSNSAMTTTLYSRYTVDHMPPPVDKLPPAGATYVGRAFMLVTSNSQMIYDCIQNNGNYQWVLR